MQKIGSNQYLLSPGTTLPKHLVPCKPSSSLIHLDDFLYNQSRRTHHVKGDGNCLFRAISHQLYATEDFHAELRQCLHQFIQQSKTKYEAYWIHSTVSYNDHLQQLMHLGSWGTQLELKAFSDYLDLPLYICSPNPTTKAYRWEKFTPYYCSRVNNITLPNIALPPTSRPFSVNHLKIAHSHTRDHYDSIIPYSRHSPLLQAPEVTPRVVASITVH